jgi:hypothetical protein
LFYFFDLYDLEGFEEDLYQTFGRIRMHTLPMVLFDSLVMLALAFKYVENDRCYLTMDLSRVSITQSNEPVVQEVLSDSKLSELVVILVSVVNQC